MTTLGVPVFNTPGSNANAVKELVLCSLFLASRGIIDGSLHMKKLHAEGVASERIEKDKALFGGQEIKGKTLGVIGLGHIGAAVVRVVHQRTTIIRCLLRVTHDRGTRCLPIGSDVYPLVDCVLGRRRLPLSLA